MTPKNAKPGSAWTLFSPILPGASLRGRLIGSIGALFTISLTALICALVTGHGLETAILVAPMGASAVLLFAVPSSPLAQPWPVIGGNTLSALAGVVVASLVPNEIAAAGLAVCLAIVVMSFTRSLHPPGGAAALVVVLGGADVTAAGYAFAFVPVALNAILMTAGAIAFHRLSGQSYPQRPQPPVPKSVHGTADLPPAVRIGFNKDDIDAAISEIGHAMDISRMDIVSVLDRVQAHTLARTHGGLRCSDIMSRDVIRVAPDTGIGEARDILIDRGIRTLPVTDSSGTLLGQVTLRQLLGSAQSVGAVMSPAVTATADDDALSLITPLSGGLHHAVAILGENDRLVGLVTQTDLLVALARTPPATP